MATAVRAGGADSIVRIFVPVLRRNIRLLAVGFAGGASLGLIIALVLPRWYTARSSFQPESQNPGALSAGLAGIASQLAASALGGQANPQFYADLIRSDVVLRRVAQRSFVGKDGLRPLADIYKISDAAPERRIQKTMTRLRDGVRTDVNIRTGVVSFTATGRTPEMAKAVADSILAAVNDFNINIRQTRARAEYAFAEARADEAARALSAAENAVAQFNMRNRVFSSPALQIENDRLKRVADIAAQVYLQLRLQAEQAAVQQVRDTPALTVIDAPSLPIKASSPRKVLSVLAGALAGLLGVLILLMYRGGMFALVGTAYLGAHENRHQ